MFPRVKRRLDIHFLKFIRRKSQIMNFAILFLFSEIERYLCKWKVNKIGCFVNEWMQLFKLVSNFSSYIQRITKSRVAFVFRCSMTRGLAASESSYRIYSMIHFLLFRSFLFSLWFCIPSRCSRSSQWFSLRVMNYLSCIFACVRQWRLSLSKLQIYKFNGLYPTTIA